MSDWGDTGTIYKSGSGQLFSAGERSRVFWCSLLASGTTGKLRLRNGGETGNIYVQLDSPTYRTGGALVSELFDLGSVGLEFPDGCFVDFGVRTVVGGAGLDSGVTSATISARKEHISKI